jgi:hypothetical protein
MTSTTQKKEPGSKGALSTLLTKKTAPADSVEAIVPIVTIIPKPSARDGITYSEDGAAERLGIPLDDLQWIRKSILESGKEFTREGGFVRINAAGIKRLEEILAGGRTLIVTGTQIPNPQLVLAKLPGGSDVLRVRVSDRDSWCRGMVIDQAQPTENPKIWSTTIRPQFKGRA